MTDVLFITPTKSANILKESVGTLLLSTILRQKGVQVEILPFSQCGDPADFSSFLDAALQLICSKQPKILSFYTRCDCYHIMIRLAQLVKERMDCPIIFGGPQADITAVQTLTEIPQVDYVCCGEGETVVYPFFSSLLQGKPNLTLPGLVYRVGKEIKANPRPELLEDLDSLPLLDYSVFPADAKADSKQVFPIDVGRGCPFGCTYCSTKTFWGRKYRLKSPRRIVQELQYYHDRFGVTHFEFQHDMFTMNRKQVMETCRLMQELSFPIRWNCSARVDCIDEELIDVMAEAGLKMIYLGIETGSPRMQKLINKNLKLEQVLPILRHIRAKNIVATSSFIYGFPQETPEDLSQTLSLVIELLRLRRVRVQMHLCAFLPSTALFEEYKDRLKPALGVSDVMGNDGVAECAELFAVHPELFLYFNEYHTELRSKLRHLPLFVDVFRVLRPVYLYFAETYPKDKLLQMYLDFAEANRSVLEDDSLTDDEKLHRIVQEDAFAARFADAPHADIVADVCRLLAARSRVQHKQSPTATELCSISPASLDSDLPLQEYPRCICIATYFLDENGRVKIRLQQT